jgi:hypothetical protein
MSYAERQLRARCWWAIYGLERYVHADRFRVDVRMVSIALGRPLGVDDLDIDVGYPSEVDDTVLQRMVKENRDHTPEVEAHGSTMSGFVALTKLCKISGRVAHLLYRPSNKSVVDPHWAHSQQTTINKLDKSLRDWLANEVVCRPVRACTDDSLRNTRTLRRIGRSSSYRLSCRIRTLQS